MSPGWYPNPSGAPGRVYWDGHAWHAPVIPSPTPASPPANNTAKTAGALAIGLTGAIITAAIVVVVIAGALVMAVVIMISSRAGHDGPAPTVTDTATPPFSVPSPPSSARPPAVPFPTPSR
jgi:hypothetical protein